MGIAEIIIVLLSIATGIAFLAGLILKTTLFFREHYSFDVWPGIFLMLFSLICIVISSTAVTLSICIFFQIVGYFSVAYILIQNIRQINYVIGFGCFVFQFFVAISCIAILLMVVVRLIISRLHGRTKDMFAARYLSGISFGTSFWRYFRIW